MEDKLLSYESVGPDTEPNTNLIAIQRQVAKEGQLDYGPSAADSHLQEISLTRDDLETEVKNPSDAQIEALTVEEAETFRTLSHIKNDRYSEATSGIESLLLQAGAGSDLFNKLAILKNQIASNSKNENLFGYAIDLVNDGWALLKQKHPEVAGMYVKPGQLDYSTVKGGQNLQPNTKTFGSNNNSTPGQLAY